MPILILGSELSRTRGVFEFKKSQLEGF